MTNYSTSKKKNALLATAILFTAGFGGALVSSTSAEAMVMNNCTGKSQYIRLRGQDSKTVMYNNKNLRAGQRVNVDLGRSQKYQVVIGAGNSRKTFSGWGAAEEISFVTIGGNTEISRGNKCKQAAVKPPKRDRDSGGDLGTRLHIKACLARYRSYNPEDNTWIDFNGNERQCRSPFQ